MENANKMERIVYDMLTENTGISIMDSGGNGGRHWQRNQKKTLQDFKNEPSVTLIDLPEKEGDTVNSDEVYPAVSTFHYLTRALETDILCDEFNALPVNDWDADIDAYGVSEYGAQWLEAHSLKSIESWNTYNGDESLDQTLQGANIVFEGNESSLEFPDYILLQVHNGADVRGGYTDAKLFRLSEDCTNGWLNPMPDCVLNGTRKDGTTYELDTMYNGTSFTDDSGEPVQIAYSDTITSYLMGE